MIVYNKYSYGSSVYGTTNEFSDEDFIVVGDGISNDPNITVYSPEQFQQKLHDHEISALEVYFLPDVFVMEKKIDFDFTLDKSKLRESLAAKSSNSWVKCKKKLMDGEDYIGIKSLFHSFRIIEFGLQIATHNRIVDYSSSNWIWNELLNLYRFQELSWSALEFLYKRSYNGLRSEFRKISP